MERKDEAKLIKDILGGETRAFSYVVKRYQGPVHSLISQIINCREDAEELTQDVFVKAFIHFDTFRGGSSLSTWLHRIAYNTAISSVRKKKQVFLDLNGAFENIADQDADKVLDQEEDEKLIERMRQAIEKLPPEERALLSLYYNQSLPVAQVAEITGLSPENVKVRLHRVRKKIVYILQNCNESG